MSTAAIQLALCYVGGQRKPCIWKRDVYSHHAVSVQRFIFGWNNTVIPIKATNYTFNMLMAHNFFPFINRNFLGLMRELKKIYLRNESRSD